MFRQRPQWTVPNPEEPRSLRRDGQQAFEVLFVAPSDPRHSTGCVSEMTLGIEQCDYRGVKRYNPPFAGRACMADLTLEQMEKLLQVLDQIARALQGIQTTLQNANLSHLNSHLSQIAGRIDECSSRASKRGHTQK